MKQIVCPCCHGAGRIKTHEPLPTYLPPIGAKIYRAVKARPGVIGGHDLVDIVYGDHRDGGPETAMDSIHVLINKMNKRLATVGECLKADRRGPGATYSIVKL